MHDAQLALFGGNQPSQAQPALPDADVRHLVGFLSRSDADALLRHALDTIDWRQDTLRVFGKEHMQPRLTQWFGPPGGTYRYSGIEMRPVEWPSWLEATRQGIEATAGVRFNSMLGNLYRNGQDTVGWHADDEPELGHQPVIASLSLGAGRDFRLKHRTRDDVAPVTLHLGHGDLLVMAGNTQHAWLHTVPRRARVSKPRVNFTFRRLVVP